MIEELTEVWRDQQACGLIDVRLIDYHAGRRQTQLSNGETKKGEDRRTIIFTSPLADNLAVMAFLCYHGSAVTYQLGWRRDAPTHRHIFSVVLMK